MNLELVIHNRFLMVLLIPFILGLSSALSFQPYNLIFINFIVIPLLFLILSYVNKKSKSKYRKKPHLKNLFFIGYFFGFGFFLSGIYWISTSLTFDENLKFLVPIATLLIPMFLGLFFGIATLISGPRISNNFSSILIFSCSFAVLDYLRSKILTGFPWNLWSYSWSWLPEVIQILNPIGVFAFNILSITIFCTPLLLIFKKNKLNFKIFTFLILIFFCNYIYGSIKLNQSEKTHNNFKTDQENFTNIKIISPKFELNYNLSLDEIKLLLHKLIKYSDPENNRKTIFVWPEGVFAGYELNEIQEFKEIIEKNFSEKHIILFGVNTKENNSGRLFNSMIAINNKFEVIYKYNKKKLVPFGEFLPLENLLSKFNLKKVTQGYGSFLKGKDQKNFEIEKLNILPLICYEIIFPQLTQDSSDNTNLIINISEDAWFGGTIGPNQHFVKAIYRAIENNSYLIRSANKGISAFIDNNGNVIKQLSSNEAGSIELNVPFINNKKRNKNDLIFFILLITYMLIVFTIRKFNYEK